MAQRLIKFPSIGQYRNVIHTITHRATYIGKGEDGGALYDPSLPCPTLKFQGTIKLHGTNAAIARDQAGEVWCQSRENIITPQSDNAGGLRCTSTETTCSSTSCLQKLCYASNCQLTNQC